MFSSFTSSRTSDAMSSYSSSSSSSTTTSQRHSSPIQISLGFTPGGSDALHDIFPTSSGVTSSATAFPSWPTSNCLYSPPERKVSSYISDEDLFGLDDDSEELPYLSEAPAPPREARLWEQPPQQLQQPLPQLIRPKVHFRKSPKKATTARRTSKTLPTVRESSM